jgi:hypothetical protein
VTELLPHDVPPPAPDELVLQVGGGAGEPERLLHISRPVDGLVRVREWTSESWNTPPLERELSARALLRAIEEAARQRRRVSEELYRVREWLGADR